MEEDLQNSSNDKKPAFLSKSVDKKTLIIIVCSLLCFFIALLLFFFISSNNRKNQIKSFSRPSIHAPKKAPNRNMENLQQSEHKTQIQNSDMPSQTHSSGERMRREDSGGGAPRGIYPGETPEQAHQRRLKEREMRGERGYRQERHSRDRRQRQNKSQSRKTERERPKLNS